MLKMHLSLLQKIQRAIIGETVIGASPDFYPASNFATFLGGLGVHCSLDIFQVLVSFSFPSVTTYWQCMPYLHFLLNVFINSSWQASQLSRRKPYVRSQQGEGGAYNKAFVCTDNKTHIRFKLRMYRYIVAMHLCVVYVYTWIYCTQSPRLYHVSHSHCRGGAYTGQSLLCTLPHL